MDPVFASNDPRLNLQQWDKDALRYEQHFGEKVPETMRRSVYQNRIAPKDVAHHLLLNSSVFKTCESIRSAIEQFGDAKEEQEQSTGSNGSFINSLTPKKPRTEDKK